MSYIRCLSNPESLYVWPDVDGTVHLHYGGRRMVKPPLSKGEELRVPTKIFMRAVEKWEASGEDRTIVDGFRVEEVYIYLKTGKRVREQKDLLRTLADMRKHPSEFKIRVSYKGNFIHLWRVTWQYVVNNVLERKFQRHKLRRKLRRQRARAKSR